MTAGTTPPESSTPRESAAWQPGPQRPQLAHAEVHVWRAQLPELDGLDDLLSDEERLRASRIAGERQRLLWARSRGALRALLARYLDADPAAIVLSASAEGKPCLADQRAEQASGSELHFNLSHSGELALYAFTQAAPLGIDVELARADERPARDHVALAQRVFGEHEATRIGQLEPVARERELLRLWTRYEAELKRQGRGIVGGSARLEEHASVVELELGEDCAAALATERPASALRLWRLA
jgi:4'-phosphopantetheinyl transferase